MSQKRAFCEPCLRPASMCFCDLISPVPSEHRVVIVQHPMEQKHSKGTGLLLHRCLPNSTLLVAEQLTPEQLSQACAGLPPLLLYPQQSGVAAPPPRTEQNYAVIVLDASWRKSRKMLHLNSALAGLPRLSLSGSHQSLYTIRKAQRPEQRSSLEAACAALDLLEPRTPDLGKIRLSMEHFIARLQRWAPITERPA